MEKIDYQKHLLSPDGSINPEVDPVRSACELECWVDGVAGQLIEAVTSGFEYYITEITIHNLGAASVVAFYDALVADQAEGTWKVTIDVPGTDTTVWSGMLVFKTAASLLATVCAAAHNLKVHMSGLKVKT